MAGDYSHEHKRTFDWQEALDLYESVDRPSKSEIARQLGTTRKSVAKAIRKMREERDDPQSEPNTHLERELLEVKDKHVEAQAKLKQAYRDETLLKTLQAELAAAIEPFTTTPPNAAVKKHNDSTLVHGVALLSDEHGDLILDPEQIWGLDHYSFDIFRCRLQAWANIIVNYVNVYLPKHKFEKLWICKLGDGIQGDIHGHDKLGYFKSSLKGAIAVGEAESQAINWIRQKTGIPVTVLCVSGNHPRRSITKDYGGPQDNFDYLIATQIQARLSGDEGLRVFAPNSWTVFADVLGHVWALNHGDDVKSYQGFPWYGFDRKNQRVQALASRLGFRINYFGYGHYHSDAKSPSAGAKSYHNGGWYYTDPHALNKLSVGDVPQQNFYIVSEKRGVIMEIPILLRDSVVEKAYLKDGVEPAFGEHTVMDEVAFGEAENLVIKD